MPIITTALAIESLLQYNPGEILATESSPPESGDAAVDSPPPAVAKRFYYSPALYTTPAPAPIPDVSSIAFSPTTYVVNHKRRDARPCTAALSRVDGFEEQPEGADLSEGDRIMAEEGKAERLVGFLGNDVEIEEEVDDDFIDPRDSVSVGTSGSDVEDGRSRRRGVIANQLSVLSRSQDEYFDAAEEFFSDSSFSNSSRSYRRNTENELRSLRLSLIEESSRRNVAEENILFLNKHWEKLVKCLCLSGSSCPEIQNFKNPKNEIDPMELCQEIVVLKFVSEALEADLAIDEFEETFKEIIVSKNQEISRLWDRMLYYEAMNREMSQKNQETVELARKRRLRRRAMQRWFWRSVGLSITVGASLLAYSYLHHYGMDLSSASISNTSTSNIE